jgi:hypothetical protein
MDPSCTPSGAQGKLGQTLMAASSPTMMAIQAPRDMGWQKRVMVILP